MSAVELPSQHVGDLTITAISDGYLTVSLDLLSNIEPGDATRMQNDAGEKDPSSVYINCYLVRGGGRTVLIDTGAGGIKNWGGHLTTNLSRAGVQPSDIDTILLTHAHPDHVGGLIDATGEAAFANAELVVHRRELAFWQDDGNLNQAGERARGNFLVARRAFDGYRARLRTIDADEVLPGITAVPLPGHTPGHTGYRLESGNQSLLVWADIVHLPQIQIARPDVSIAFDQDPVLAATTRTRLLGLVSSERLLIAGMHLSNLGFAHIERHGMTYRVAYET